MKIEKISDSQIRCTLYKNDLADRHLRISELAYGSDKAKDLFRDMMQQASTEVGFDAENFPLMIEAIPVSSDCLILLITKVEDPEELDTRFSNFTPLNEDDEEKENDHILPEHVTADQILQYFEQMTDLIAEKLSSDKDSDHIQTASSGKAPSVPQDSSVEDIAKHLARAFRFASLDEVISLAHVIAPFYHGRNTLYKSPNEGDYHLVLQMSQMKPADFNKVCNIASEYASQERFNSSIDAFYKEHYEVIIKDNAVYALRDL